MVNRFYALFNTKRGQNQRELNEIKEKEETKKMINNGNQTVSKNQILTTVHQKDKKTNEFWWLIKEGQSVNQQLYDENTQLEYECNR